MLHAFELSACGCAFAIQCQDHESTSLVTAGFGAMLGPSMMSPADRVPYRIGRALGGSGFSITHTSDDSTAFADSESVLFHLDKFLTIALQRQRPDLFFLHGAALALDGRVVVVSAPSGTGKSTLAWALLEAGFEYLSDELAPVDRQKLTVHPYPHALCLKSPPPLPYRLPPETLDVGNRLHVPVGALRVTTHTQPLPLAALVFVHRHPATPTTRVRSITAAAAAAHLMSNALNALAHPGAGLDAAMALARVVPAFELDSTNLPAACAQIKALVAREAGVT